MEILSQIIIARPEGDATIQLLHGDLTAIPANMAVDVLAISAYRGDYRTTRDTLMSSLFKAGVSVADLAYDKEVDLVDRLSCWLSKPLPIEQQTRLNIKKILCFEPLGTAKDVGTEVSNLFRAINTFAIDDNHNEIAMPVLATGDRGFPLDVMLPTLLDTALFWLETGLPLVSLKLVLYRSDQVEQGLLIFENIRKQYALKQQTETGQISAGSALSEINAMNSGTSGAYTLPKMEYGLQEMNKMDENAASLERTRGIDDMLQNSTQPATYDYFISYSHKHTAAVQILVNALKIRNPAATIFYDRDTIPAGGLWIKMISDAIQNSKNVVCILTPEYSKSDVCWDEFQCAYVMEKRKKTMIRTINFCHDADLPPMIAIYSYIDCTEGDIEKLKGAVDRLVEN